MGLGWVFFHFENLCIHIENPFKVQDGQKNTARSFDKMYTFLCVNSIFFCVLTTYSMPKYVVHLQN